MIPKKIFALACLLITSDLSFAENKSNFNKTNYEIILEKALHNSPTVKQIESTISAFNSEGVQLKTLSNPEISFEVRPFTAHPSGLDVEHEVSLSQPLKLSNFGARQKVADLIATTSDIESKMLLVEFEQNILSTYGKVWALQQRKQYLQKLIARTQTLLSRISAANQGGLLPASTKTLILTEQKRLKVESDGIAAEKLKALSALTRLIGVKIEEDHFEELKISDFPERITTSDQIPLIQRINAKTRLATEQYNLARLDSFPQFTPRISFDHTADGDDRVVVGLSFPLPLFNQNQSEKLKAKAQSDAQNAAQKYAEDGTLQAELDLLLASAKSSFIQAKALRTDVLPTIEQAYIAAEREVFSGQGSPLQLWQVLTEMRDLQQRYLELWIQSLSNRSELSILTGRSF